MPDLAKCSNIKCPIKGNCFRWTCKPGEYVQSYCHFEPDYLDSGKVTCEYFIKDTKNETVRQ